MLPASGSLVEGTLIGRLVLARCQTNARSTLTYSCRGRTCSNKIEFKTEVKIVKEFAEKASATASLSRRHLRFVMHEGSGEKAHKEIDERKIIYLMTKLLERSGHRR